jgi:hypothetical protein
MGWQIGYDSRWNRDVGYGVPAECDYPACKEQIDRGLSFVCGSDPYGGEHGCGLYFCEDHLTGLIECGERWAQVCDRCEEAHVWDIATEPYQPKPDVQEWTDFKETDPSWAQWRAERDQAKAVS